jgi:glycosyltransferase involved in cell wall biosynthesis
VSAQRAARPRLLVASMLTGDSPSGVDTHANTIVAHARRAGVAASFVSAQLEKDLGRRLAGVRRRLVRPFDRERALHVERTADAALLERKLRRLIGEAGGGPLVVYAQDPASAGAALRARGAGTARVVMTVHFNVSEAHELSGRGLARAGGPLWNAALALEREVLPRLDRLIFVSAFMQDTLLRRLPGLAAVPRSLLPNFREAPAPAVPAPGEGCMADVIAVGTLEPRKNQGYLLEVLAACRDAGRRYTCTIVGGGADMAALQAATARLGLDGQVRLLGHRADAAQLIARHRVFAHAARMENLPIALIEALACGRPVIAAPVGGIPELVADGVEGLHWPLDDAPAAARRLIELLESPGLWDRAAAAARRAYETRYSPEVLGPRWLAALLEPRPA